MRGYESLFLTGGLTLVIDWWKRAAADCAAAMAETSGATPQAL